MSDPNNKAALPDPADELKPHRVTDRTSFWWTLSIVVHAAVILSVIFITPLRDWLFQRGRGSDEIALNASRIRQISEDMRSASRHRHELQMNEMWKIHEKLAAIRDRKFAQLQAREENNKTLRIAKLPAELPRHADVPISQLYDQMLAMEQAIADTYQELRTAKLAIIQNIAMSDAAEATKVPVPPRAQLNKPDLDGVVDTTRDNRLERFRQQLRTIADEEIAMVNYAQNLLKLAEQMEAAERDGINIDLSASDKLDVGQTPGAALAPWEMTRSHENKEGTIKALPGRKLITKGSGGDWMFIDTWYLIGPFENANRRSLNTAFLPESLVDLDAEYTGKAGKKIRWQYWRTSKPRINPPSPGNYEIYYGYTEIYCDEERAFWVALGSDDFGKLWVNDQLVWISPTASKAFKEDEQFQLITFKKGINRLLFRLENAGGLMGYSLIINTAPTQ